MISRVDYENDCGIEKSSWNQVWWIEFELSEVIKFSKDYQMKGWDQIILIEWSELIYKNSCDDNEPPYGEI